MSGPSYSPADDDELPEVSNSAREERQRRIEERRRQRNLRRSYMEEDTPVVIPDEEEEERRRRERREERRRRREAEAAMEKERMSTMNYSDEQSLSQSDRIDLSSQISKEGNIQKLSQEAIPVDQEVSQLHQEVSSHDQDETPLDQPTQDTSKTEENTEEAKALLQLELDRLRQKAEEEKRQEEEKRKKKKEEEERLIQEIEKQRMEADLKKQREIERLKREKECEVIAEAQRLQQSEPVSSPSPSPREDEDTMFDVMLKQEEERKQREEKQRREEERMWQKRTIELETNQTVTLSESTGIKRRGASIQRSNDGVFVTRETTAIPCQRDINQKYSIVTTKPNAAVTVQSSQLVDLDVNPFADETPELSPITPPQQNPKPSANPFGNEEDVLSRFKECNEVVIEPVPMDSLSESSPRNPFDNPQKPTDSLNPFDRMSESTDSVKNPFDRASMQETKLNPFDQSEENPSTPRNPFDQDNKGNTTPRNPFDQSEESSSKPLNPFDQSDKSETPRNPFDQSDKNDTPLNPFDRESLTAPSESSLEESGPYRKSVVKDAMDILEIATEGKMTAAELQNQMEQRQEEKQLEAIRSLYDTDPDGMDSRLN